MDGPIPPSPHWATVEALHPVLHSADYPSPIWLSGSVCKQISPMQTIQEEAGEVDLTAPSTSSDPAPEIGENSLEHSNQDKDNIAPEIAEYVEKIRAAIKMQAESLKVQKTNMRGPEEQEGKLACQSRVGRKYKRSSFILLRDKARNNMSNVKLRGKRMSKLSNAEIPKQERRSRGGPDLDTNSVNARP